MIRDHLRDNAVLKAKASHTDTTDYICSPSELAWAIKVAPSTIFKMHSGDFSLKSLHLIEGILGVCFTEKLSAHQDSASNNKGQGIIGVKIGGYTKQQIEPYIGRYLTIRQGTTIPENLLTTLVEIYWDTKLSGARFNEINKFVSSQGKKLDYSQSGTVHQSSQIGVLHLLTSFEGALRLVTLSRLQVLEPVMYGAILTQVPESGNFVPTKATVHFRKIGDGQADLIDGGVGVITPEHPKFKTLYDDLETARSATLAR